MIRILFVDDEPSVFQVVQRAVHDMRNGPMQFASSGAAALEELAKKAADVVVSDMRNVLDYTYEVKCNGQKL